MWWLPSIALFIFGFYLANQNILSDFKIKELANVEFAKNQLNDILSERLMDLMTIKGILEEYEVDRLNEQKNPRLIKILKHYVAETTFYDQLRFIDLSGQELLRINYRFPEATVVSQEQLQNKQNRYYFQQALDLEHGEIYISPLDLNVEHGKIELPIQPVMRLGTPIFSPDGRKLGLLFLNYRGQNLLNKLTSVNNGVNHSLRLLNSLGYWLHHPDPQKTWGFMYGNDERFGKYYPEFWSIVSAKQYGQLHSQNMILSYATISPITDSTNKNYSIKSFIDPNNHQPEVTWKVISVIDKKALNDIQGKMLNRFSLMGIPLLLILIVVSWRLAIISLRHRQARIALKESNEHLERTVELRTRDLSKEIEVRKQAEERMRRMANYDSLTKIPNRALFNDRLQMVIEMNKRRTEVCALFFLDLDGFKAINDNFGHKVGDQLLVHVSQRLLQTVRITDIVGRYGGDEFVILLHEIHQIDIVNKIASGVIEKISDTFFINGNEIQIGCSIGIAIYQGEPVEVNQLIHIADDAMYKIKKSGKNNYLIDWVKNHV